MKFANIVFDCDSTLSGIEGIDYLARGNSNYDLITAMTNKAMNNGSRIDYEARLQLIDLYYDDLIRLAQVYYDNITPGAEQVIKTLLELGKNCYVLSAGMNPAVEIFARRIGIAKSNVFAVNLNFDVNGRFTSVKSGQCLTNINGKIQIIKEIAANGNTVMIGDGFNDLAVHGYADKVIGFGGWITRAKLVAKFDEFVYENNFNELLPKILTEDELSTISLY